MNRAMAACLGIFATAGCLSASCFNAAAPGETLDTRVPLLIAARAESELRYQIPNPSTGPARFIAQFQNVTDSTVYLARCGDLALWDLQHLSHGVWTDVNEIDCPAIGAPPMSVAPGAKVIETVFLRGLSTGGGPYRLAVGAYSTADGAAGDHDSLLLAEHLRVTQPFRVK